MATSFDHTFDVVVIGSGAAAFATALGPAVVFGLRAARHMARQENP